MLKSFLGRDWSLVKEVNILDNLKPVFIDQEKLKEYDPLLLLGMKKTIKRIKKAQEKKEQVIIYGDFDADGITSTVLLVHGLRKLGIKVSYRIPDREKDSHGLKKDLLIPLFEKKISLLITCDNGINDAEIIQWASKRGLDIIVTDHHFSDEVRFPHSAISVLNPHQKNCPYPNKNLAGVGVVYKLLHALALDFFPNPKEIDIFLKPYLELVCIGLLADCMKICGENKLLIRRGLEGLKNSQWPPIQKILEINRINSKEITEETVYYFLAPRINAASRIGNVYTATELFLSPEKIPERIAKLEEWNETRRTLTEKFTQEARSMIYPWKKFQWIFLSDCPAGILGLVAGKLCEELQQPLLVANKSNGFFSASCRSPNGFNMIEMLQSMPDFFDRFGGHSGAAGFTISEKKQDLFLACVETYTEQHPPITIPIAVTAILHPTLVNFSLVDLIKSHGPYGVGNEEKIFQLNNAKVVQVEKMGSGQNHLRILVQISETVFLNFLGFFMGHWSHIKPGGNYDFLYTVGDNFWQDERRLQLKLIDMRKSDPSRSGKTLGNTMLEE